MYRLFSSSFVLLFRFYCLFVKFFPTPLRFFDLACYYLFSFFRLDFLSSFVSPLLFRSCFAPVFWLMWFHL
jgi:hypothetical protein